MSYCQRSDIEDIFGVTNVAQWADLDNDEKAAKITARIARAIAVADAEVDSRLRGSPLTVPVVDSAGDTPVLITDVAARLAGVWLYENRGVQDAPEDSNGEHRLSGHRRRAEKQLAMFRANPSMCGGVVSRTVAPEVVKE